LTLKLAQKALSLIKGMVLAVKNVSPNLSSISVDASGGWTLSDALHMQ
jgi:L-alanine-DL-glutamate epimerase-like enolase superfamily enzyme